VVSDAPLPRRPGGHGRPDRARLADRTARDRQPDGGTNVIYHEFAHKLDQLDGVFDGMPPLGSDEGGRWEQTMGTNYRRLRRRGDPLVRACAATNEVDTSPSSASCSSPCRQSASTTPLYDLCRLHNQTQRLCLTPCRRCSGTTRPASRRVLADFQPSVAARCLMVTASREVGLTPAVRASDPYCQGPMRGDPRERPWRAGDRRRHPDGRRP
jgi:hypothetical protein